MSDQNTTAFKEVAIIRDPRIGEYAFGFITSSVTLQLSGQEEVIIIIIKFLEESETALTKFCSQTDQGEEELCSVYVPTNHLYIGDIFLVNSEEIIRPNLSIREGIGQS